MRSLLVDILTNLITNGTSEKVFKKAVKFSMFVMDYTH